LADRQTERTRCERYNERYPGYSPVLPNAKSISVIRLETLRIYNVDIYSVLLVVQIIGESEKSLEFRTAYK